jgi:predicted nicotinamide N-methyase
MRPSTPVAFVRANTQLARTPFVPEVRLHLADEVFALWERIEATVGPPESPLPFWAFAWAGGQALARYVLDHPDLVRGRRVLDVGSGSGLVAIAAATAGAEAVMASEVDHFAIAAIALNAEANGVVVAGLLEDVLDGDGADAEVVLGADLFYEQLLAERVVPFLGRARARGAAVLVGDPGRAHLPRARFEVLATYDVPVMRGLEDAEVKPAMVWRPIWG